MPTTDACPDVPSTVVCSGFTPEHIKAAVEQGDTWVADLADLRDVTYVDLPTSHWPMWSRPQELATVIGDASQGASGRVAPAPRGRRDHPASTLVLPVASRPGSRARYERRARVRMDAGETPHGWLTLEEVARLQEVDVSVVRDAIRRRVLSGVTTHPAHPWRWMVRRCDAEAWTPRIQLPEQPAASLAEAPGMR